MTNVLYVPFRAQLLVKTLCLTVLFSAAMPILYVCTRCLRDTPTPPQHHSMISRYAAVARFVC